MPSPATDVRRHILDVARPLLLHRGFTAVGLQEVLAAAGVPKGSFYHYFGSKEAFGEAVIDAYFADNLDHVDAILAGPGSAAERLVAYFADWRDSQVDDRPDGRCLVVKLGAEVCDLSESMRVALDRGTRRVIARVAAAIAAGHADGSIPADVAPAGAASLYQTWLGASLLADIARDGAPLDAALADTRRLFGLDA